MKLIFERTSKSLSIPASEIVPEYLTVAPFFKRNGFWLGSAGISLPVSSSIVYFAVPMRASWIFAGPNFLTETGLTSALLPL